VWNLRGHLAKRKGGRKADDTFGNLEGDRDEVWMSDGLCVGQSVEAAIQTINKPIVSKSVKRPGGMPSFIAPRVLSTPLFDLKRLNACSTADVEVEGATGYFPRIKQSTYDLDNQTVAKAHSSAAAGLISSFFFPDACVLLLYAHYSDRSSFVVNQSRYDR
jgi:hypothetical protein